LLSYCVEKGLVVPEYRNDPKASQITLKAKGGQSANPTACTTNVGTAEYSVQAHKGSGGAGTGACSGDLLLGGLSACAQITCQMVAASLEIPVERIEVTVEGFLDLRGALAMSESVPVGFQRLHLRFEIEAAKPTPQQLHELREKTEQYCVILQTLVHPPTVQSEWVGL
jgi:uncharacterized OsmC-like protein